MQSHEGKQRARKPPLRVGLVGEPSTLIENGLGSRGGTTC